MKLSEVLQELDNGNFIRRPHLGDDGFIGLDEAGMFFSAGYPGHGGTVTINTSFDRSDVKADDWEVVVNLPQNQCNHPSCKMSTGRLKNPHPFTHKWPTDANNRKDFIKTELAKLSDEEKTQIPHPLDGHYSG